MTKQPTRVPKLALVLLGALATAGDLAAQRVVPVANEPRHRLVLEHGDLKVLDVQIQPGDTTLDHTHAQPILYTFISSGTGSSNGRVSGNTEYATKPYTHHVTNEGPGLFRIIAVAHYGRGAENVTGARPEGLKGDPQLENPWFRSYRLELAPGEETALHRHQNPAFVVLVTDGRAEVSKANGFGAELTRMGDWTMREAGAPYTVRNAGSTPISVVVNEGRGGR